MKMSLQRKNHLPTEFFFFLDHGDGFQKAQGGRSTPEIKLKSAIGERGNCRDNLYLHKNKRDFSVIIDMFNEVKKI